VPKITKLCFGFETRKKLPKRLPQNKCVRKTLMKMTPGRDIKAESFKTEHKKKERGFKIEFRKGFKVEQIKQLPCHHHFLCCTISHCSAGHLIMTFLNNCLDIINQNNTDLSLSLKCYENFLEEEKLSFLALTFHRFFQGHQNAFGTTTTNKSEGPCK